MKTTSVKYLLILLVLAFLPGVQPSLASHHEADPTTSKDVKQKVAETYETLKDYSVEQRDQAMSTAKESLREIDAQINQTEHKLDEGWDRMTVQAREKTRETLEILQKQRNDLAEWYGGMQHSSADAWDMVKKGFADSYDRLKQSLKAAGQEFGKKE